MDLTKKQPTLLLALIPIAILILLLTINVVVLGNDAISGANQIALLLASGVAGIISFRLGYSWDEIEGSIVKSISSAMAAMLILLAIGSLSGTWLLSGIVPSMIYYPVPAHRQKMFDAFGGSDFVLPDTDWLTERVISLPIHTELDEEQQSFIVNNVLAFVNN